MNIDTTATILQVSPASATRAEVAGPQLGGNLGAGFAQLLAALLSGTSTAPSPPVSTTATLPESRPAPKPAEPATSFDRIYAIFNSQPAAQAIAQTQPVPAQVQQPVGSPTRTSPGTKTSAVLATPVDGTPPFVAVDASRPAVNVMSPARPQVDLNSPQGSPPQVCPAVQNGTLPQSVQPDHPVQQPLSPPATSVAMSSPGSGSVTPAEETGPSVPVTQQIPEFNGTTEAQSPNVEAVPANPPAGGDQSSNSQTPVTVAPAATDKFGLGITDVGSQWASAFTPSNVGNVLAKATGWSLGQLRLAHSEASAKRDLLSSMARKFGNNAGAMLEELAQRVGQAGNSAASEVQLSQQGSDGQSAGDPIPDAAPLDGTARGDTNNLLQHLTEVSAHVSHSGQAAESLPHHDRVTIAQVPQRLAEIVAARMEQPHSASQSSVVLRLDPPELGRVTVHVSMVNDAVSIRLVASDDGSRQTLETHLNDLQQSLSDQGISLNHCQVDCSAGGSDSGTRNRHWPIPGDTESFPPSSRPAPAVANPLAPVASRAKLDYVA